MVPEKGLLPMVYVQGRTSPSQVYEVLTFINLCSYTLTSHTVIEMSDMIEHFENFRCKKRAVISCYGVRSSYRY